MFDALRRSLFGLDRRDRRTARIWPTRLGASFERLEARRMLSVEPVFSYWIESAVPPVAKGGDVLNVAGSEVAFGAGAAWVPTKGASFASLSVKARASESSLPPNGHEVPSAVPNQRYGPSIGVPRDFWLNVPNGWPELEPPTLPSRPDWSGEGGYIELDAANSPAPSGLYSDNSADQETREVLELLSALRFLPNKVPSESTNFPGRASSHSSANQPPDTLRSEAFSRPNDRAPVVERIGFATTAPERLRGKGLDDKSSEGGMVAFSPESLTTGPAATGVNQIRNAQTLLEVPMQMDAQYGKFQAFEMSPSEPPASSVRSKEQSLDTRNAPNSEPPMEGRRAQYREVSSPSTANVNEALQNAGARLDPIGDSPFPAGAQVELDNSASGSREFTVTDQGGSLPLPNDAKIKSTVYPIVAALLAGYAAIATRNWRTRPSDTWPAPTLRRRLHQATNKSLRIDSKDDHRSI